MTNIACNIDFEGLRRVLLSMPSETETEFLALGERLKRLSKKAEELLSFSGEIGKLLGVEGDSASEDSMVSFVEIANLLEMGTQNLEDVFSSLHQGLDLLRDIEVKVSKLPRLNRILRGIGDNIKMVGVNIKIKSATAGKAGEGFKALSHRRDMQRDKLVTFSEDILQRIAGAAEEQTGQIDRRMEALRACLAELPADDLRLLELKYVRRASLAEHARQRGWKPNRLQKALSRIRLALRHCIESRLSKHP